MATNHIALLACGAFYALLCVFSIVTGALYLFGKRKLNPVELSDRLVRRLTEQGRLERFARIMGLVTMLVGVAQGVAAWSILCVINTPARYYAVGFTLFSLFSVVFKLSKKVSAFPLVKLVAYVAVLLVLIIG